MITVTLCGELADIFIETIDIAVTSVAEAIAALRANFPKFASYLYEAAHRGVNYQIKVGFQEVDETQLCNPISQEVRSIRIIPVIAGSGTVGRIIGGVALLGLGLAGVGFLGLGATQLVLLGGAMLLGGISSLFGRVKSPADDESSGKKSLVFGSPSTTQQEGGRVPIAYGVVLCGLYIVNAKVVSYLTS
jgi:predicted phage tail protein